MARRRNTRKNRRSRSRNRRTMRGGGPGAAYSVEGVLVPGMPYLVNNPISNCQATAPDYALKGVSASGLPGMSGPGPLPGIMSGGSRGPLLANNKGPIRIPNRDRMRHIRRRPIRGSGSYNIRAQTLRGGVYAVDPVPVGGLNSPNVAATFDRMACHAGAPPHVSPTIPTQPGYASLPGAVPAAMRGVPEPATITSAGFQQSGGALQPPYSGSPVLEETTAGYTHLRTPADATVSQSGVPVMFNVPSGGRLGVPDACVKTGGARRRRGSKRRHRRSHRK